MPHVDLRFFAVLLASSICLAGFGPPGAGPARAEAQVVEWAAHTRGRMIDVFDAEASPEHLVAMGLTMMQLARATYDHGEAGRARKTEAARFDYERFVVRERVSAQAVVSRDREHAVVAIRGSSHVADWFFDAMVIDERASRFRGAHQGFAWLSEALLPRVRDQLDRLRRDGVEHVWLTGHSLGGAMAQIMAQDLDRRGYPVEGVFAFGAPAVGKETWSSIYRLPGRTHLFELEGDLVPCLPPNQAQWQKNGHLHRIRDDGRVELYAFSDVCAARIPEAAFGRPVCDAPSRVRRALAVFAPHTRLMCETPDPLRALADVLADALNGNRHSRHSPSVYQTHLRLGREETATRLIGHY